MLWKFNRFLPEKPLPDGDLAKTLLLMLIDVPFPAICLILPRGHLLFKRTVQTTVCV